VATPFQVRWGESHVESDDYTLADSYSIAVCVCVMADRVKTMNVSGLQLSTRFTSDNS